MMLDLFPLMLGLTLVLPCGALAASPETAAPPAEAPLSADELVRLALAANPQVKAAAAQYRAALHQIDQAYTPQDPEFSYASGGSQNGLKHPSSQTLSLSESFQFPGKAWLQ